MTNEAEKLVQSMFRKATGKPATKKPIKKRIVRESSRGRKMDPIDSIIAARMQQYRAATGMNVTEAAHALGLSYQQVYKYEVCQNRIAASMLYHMAELYGVTVADFFVPVAEEEE